MKKFIYLGLIVSMFFIGYGRREASNASYNISYEADNFKVLRRVVFYNGITNDYMLSVEGYCSIEKDNADNQLELVCKVGNEYKKHFLGLSDNVTYFVEQMNATNVSTNHYKVLFKPSSLLPEIVTK